MFGRLRVVECAHKFMLFKCLQYFQRLRIQHIGTQPKAHLVLIVLLLFLQKQNLALAVYLFGLVLSLPD